MAKTATKTSTNVDSVDNTNKPKCFIIMPFGGWFDKYNLEIYIPAIEAAGFDAKRADDLYRPGNIVNDIWTYTKEATVLLADLTNKNPNVFYELGLAHAITKPAVLITASMEDVPFDLRSLRVIEYDKNSPNWGETLKDKITKALKETLINPKDAIPPSFFEVDKTEKIKLSPESKELLAIKNEIDLLKREVRSNDSRRNRRIDENIHPEEALRLIRNYLSRGVDEAIIAEKLEPLGPPREWTYNRIEEIKNYPKSEE